MAYQALYRKYRPSSFDEVVGQRQIIQTLKNAVERNRISHAYLFSGPRGTGKTSIAKIFAKTLNCTADHKGCGECENCKAAKDGSHPDIIEIDAASNNGVDQVRSLIDKVSYAPMMGKYKIYIIDEVHMMTTGAFNALLKTIEEPPEHVIFIFATTEPQKVLPTILSRCQRFDFSKVSDVDIVSRLTQVCDKENIQVTQEALQLIASLADGGMRDSLSILDQCIAYSPDLLNENIVRTIYGVVTKEDIGKIFSQLNPESIQDALSRLQQISDDGFDLKRFIADFIAILKNSLIMDFNLDSQLISESEKKVIKEYLLNKTSDFRIGLLRDLMEIYNKLNYASNILDYIETILLKNTYENRISETHHSYDIKNSSQKSTTDHMDQTSEKKKSASKVPKNKEIHPISDQFWKSDVSRETFPGAYEVKKKVELDDDILLGLLNGADKNQKSKDMESFKTIDIFYSNMEYAKFAASLRKSQILASGNEYLVLIVGNEPQANEINEIEDHFGYEKFTNELLGTSKKIFAVSRQKGLKLIEIFKQKMKEGTLPQPPQIELRNINNSNEQKQTEEEFLKSIFPELNIVNE